MLTIPTVVAGCLTLLLLQASPCAAQSTFGSLPAKVKLGQKVVVYDAHGTKTQGTVQSVSATELVITETPHGASAVGTSRTFHPDDVTRVKKPGPIWDGAVKGAIVGALLGATCYLGDNECAGAVPSAALFVAGIGLGIDAAIPPRTLYRRSSSPSKAALSPIIGPDRRGVAFSLRF